MDQSLSRITEALSSSLELELPPTLSQEQVIELLRQKVAYLIDHNTDELFSKLYRLDVFERKIKAAMAEGGDMAYSLAVLIFERQLEKIESRKNNKATKPDDDLAW